MPLRLMLVIVFLVAGSRNGSAADDGLATTVLRDWTSHRQAIRQVRVVADGTGGYVRGSMDRFVQVMKEQGATVADLPSPLPPDDRTYPVNYLICLDFEKDCARYEVTESQYSFETGLDVPRNEVRLRRGADMQLFVRRRPEELAEHQPDAYLNRSKKFAGLFFLVPDCAVPIAMLALPWRGLNAAEMRVPLEQYGFMSFGRGRLDGRECAILRSKVTDPKSTGYHEAWADIGRTSVIARWSLWQRGKEAYRYEFSYRDEAPQPVLAGWTFTSWSDDKVDRWTKTTVREIDLSPSFTDDDFHWAPSVGMIVLDEKTQRHYVKGTTPAEDRSFDEVFGRPERSAATGRLALFVLAPAALCGALLVCAWMWNRRRVKTLG